MAEDMIDTFEGPRTIRYFAYLVLGAALLFALGAILSQLHGITWVKNLTEPFVDNPMSLLPIASVLAMIVAAIGARAWISGQD